jgi:hypothetical protein
MFSQSGGEAMVHGNTLSHVSNIPNLASLGLPMCQFPLAGSALLAPPPRPSVRHSSGFHIFRPKSSS